ncbi:YeeE/YedE thiosulfate transporter family protein [soil metagenome]
MKSWSPYVVGAGIGVLSWFTFASAGHPLGVSTSFENTAALTERAVAPQVAQNNPYFAEKAAEGKPPKINWQWMLVLGIFGGAWLSARLGNDRTPQSVPPLWRWRFGENVGKRFAAAFAGGALMMFGARLAQGCTSGHGISGTLQLALSSWIFVVGLFASGAVMAFLLFGKEGRSHV